MNLECFGDVCDGERDSYRQSRAISGPSDMTRRGLRERQGVAVQTETLWSVS